MAALAGKSSTLSALFKKKLAEHNKVLNEVKRVYGRRHGRPLSPSRQKAFDDIYPQLEIPLDLLTEQGDLGPDDLFKPPAPKTILEIGFGNGERLAEAMRHDPENHYIGAEPFLNGMTAFLKDIQNDPKDNIRVLMDDALLIARSLADETIDEIYILNPDPWHKARHHKRRIVRAETLPDYHRILKPGGKLIMTTDVIPLADWMQIETEIHSGFVWSAETPKDWQAPPKGWIPTRYETKKARGASKMTYLVYKRLT